MGFSLVGMLHSSMNCQNIRLPFTKWYLLLGFISGGTKGCFAPLGLVYPSGFGLLSISLATY